MPEARVIIFCTPVSYIKSQHTKDESPLKGAWLGSRDPFKIFGPAVISQEWLKVESSNFIHR